MVTSIKKVLYVTFILLIATILFEGGFYTSIIINTSSQLSQLVLPTSPKSYTPQVSPVIPKDAISINIPEEATNATESTLKGQLPIMTLGSILYKLKSIDTGLVQQISMNVVYKGIIADVNKDATIYVNGLPQDHYFVLQLQEPVNQRVSLVENFKNSGLNKVGFWSRIDPKVTPVPISVDEFKKGNLIEIEESIYPLPQDGIQKDIYLLKRSVN